MAKKEEKQLGIWQRFLLWAHMLYCGPCRRMHEQWKKLTAALRRWKSADRLTEEEKAALRSKLS